ncbi:MAG: HDIG domain-containing metalloprotein [Solirubrobacteraceae bacterium]
MSSSYSRQEAWALLCEWTQSESLRRHMLAVEAAMRAYASRFAGDVELWGLTGLLHDLDYERYPNLEEGHPRYALRELEARGYPPELIRAVASHADFMGVERISSMERALYAVDELSGFVLAVAYVRPDGLVGMTPKSVKKKLKSPSFAAAVGREELRQGAEELGVDFDEHLAIVIQALAERRDDLLPAEGMAAEGMAAEDVVAEDVVAEDVGAEDVVAEDVGAEDVGAEDVGAEPSASQPSRRADAPAG